MPDIRFARHAGAYTLTAELWLPRPLEDVFPFFADAANLERLTPPNLRFEILTQAPLDMHEGLLIDYRIHLYSFAMHWQSEITTWDPPHAFVDEQRKGPYTLWHHTHRFESHEGRTRCIDHVRYNVPGGPLSPLIHTLVVKPDLKRIFTYRANALASIFTRTPELAHA